MGVRKAPAKRSMAHDDTVKGVMAWVSEDPAKRAPVALIAERRRAKPRPTLVTQLEALIPEVGPSMESRRHALANGLLDDAGRLREQLFAPVVVVKPMAVGGGMHSEGRVEIVEVELDEPTFADKKLIVQSIGVIVDKLADLAGSAEAGGGDVVELSQHRDARRFAAANEVPSSR